MQAQSFESATAALDAAKETLKARNAQEAELHFGLQLFRLPAQHNADLAACERVSPCKLLGAWSCAGAHCTGHCRACAVACTSV